MDLEQFAAKESDLNNFYSQGSEPQEPKRERRRSTVRLDLPRHDALGKFIKGPIPLEWMRTASRCGVRAEAVAILLWYAAGWQRSNPVKLTPSILAELRVHPKTARRILLKMESAGLVAVVSKRGASPMVTLL